MARWWQETRHVEDLKVARKALGKRLSESVRPTNSPPEFWLFKTYYEVFGPELGYDLPTLIPQVYLHYDPQTLVQRGEHPVLPRQRMDFLMLLDHSVRIVLEVDGKHHYAEGKHASPSRYAEMVREDRTLRLRGYEVYRFGGAEFPETQDEHGSQSITPEGRAKIVEFFKELFRRHNPRVTSNA